MFTKINLRRFMPVFTAVFAFILLGGFASYVMASNIFVAITSPASGSQVSGIVPITAMASSSAGIREVDFYADSSFVGSISAIPYFVNWNTTALVPGSYHNLLALATDFSGATASSAGVLVRITPDTTAPTVMITSPADRSKVARGSVVNITATASDNYQVARVEFLVNGVLLCTDTTSPYVCAWKVPPKNKVGYILTATAFDPAGNSSSSSVSVVSR